MAAKCGPVFPLCSVARNWGEKWISPFGQGHLWCGGVAGLGKAAVGKPPLRGTGDCCGGTADLRVNNYQECFGPCVF
jgi:hypothetical protein